MRKLKKDERGFTLIELLIVIAILGVLAALAIPRFINMNKEAQIKACHTNVATLNTAIEMYRAKNNSDPANVAALSTGTTAVLQSSLTCPVTGEVGAYSFLDASDAGKGVVCSEHGDATGGNAGGGEGEGEGEGE